MSEDAIRRGIENFMATFGRVPDGFQLMLDHAPEAFAGYTTMRAFVMRDLDEGAALDMKTKELVFVLLDTMAGNAAGAKAHLAQAMRRGLTVPELVEGLVQVIMAAGITSWNLAGRAVLEHALALAREAPQAR